MTVVVKFGTSLVATPRGTIRRSLLRRRAREIADIVAQGEPVCIVSSGAIALGLPALGLERRPRALPKLQAASALGQARLHRAWEDALRAAGLSAAQVLLTATDLAERRTYINARNAVNELLRLGAVPVVNENDATATDEITFGDNDALAAQLAVLIRARVLILLTEVDGVFSRAPGLPGGELVTDGSLAHDAALGEPSPLGRGGMQSKVLAARMATAGGIPTVIAAGHGEKVLAEIVAGEPRGTRFTPTDEKTSAFKLWLRFGKPVAGRIYVDRGAEDAVSRKGGSLLAVGVVSCEGRFGPGEAVELARADGAPFAKGIALVASTELTQRPHGLEVVHRDSLVVY
jgi:glutamate 5-kinase